MAALLWRKGIDFDEDHDNVDDFDLTKRALVHTYIQ
jgi:hypothetical protein